jgi:hypothetical protein
MRSYSATSKMSVGQLYNDHNNTRHSGHIIKTEYTHELPQFQNPVAGVVGCRTVAYDVIVITDFSHVHIQIISPFKIYFSLNSGEISAAVRQIHAKIYFHGATR